MKNNSSSKKRKTSETPIPTVKDVYDEKQKEIQTLLVRLKENLKRHQQEFDKNPANWSRIGDLEYVSKVIEKVIDWI